MAQSNLVEGARNLANRVEGSILSVPTPQSRSASERRKYAKADDDAMVRKANESFRQSAEKSKTRKKMSRKKGRASSAR